MQLFSFYLKKVKEGVKLFSVPTRKASIFSFILIPATYYSSLVKCHCRRVLGQEQHFHLLSRVNTNAKVNKKLGTDNLFFFLVLLEFLCFLLFC